MGKGAKELHEGIPLGPCRVIREMFIFFLKAVSHPLGCSWFWLDVHGHGQGPCSSRSLAHLVWET